jgi:hypothetical protein
LYSKQTAKANNKREVHEAPTLVVVLSGVAFLSVVAVVLP